MVGKPSLWVYEILVKDACKRIHVNHRPPRTTSQAVENEARHLGLVAWDLDIWDVYREFLIYSWARKNLPGINKGNIKIPFEGPTDDCTKECR